MLPLSLVIAVIAGAIGKKYNKRPVAAAASIACSELINLGKCKENKGWISWAIHKVSDGLFEVVNPRTVEVIK